MFANQKLCVCWPDDGEMNRQPENLCCVLAIIPRLHWNEFTIDSVCGLVFDVYPPNAFRPSSIAPSSQSNDTTFVLRLCFSSIFQISLFHSDVVGIYRCYIVGSQHFFFSLRDMRGCTNVVNASEKLAICRPLSNHPLCITKWYHCVQRKLLFYVLILRFLLIVVVVGTFSGYRFHLIVSIPQMNKFP